MVQHNIAKPWTGSACLDTSVASYLEKSSNSSKLQRGLGSLNVVQSECPNRVLALRELWEIRAGHLHPYLHEVPGKKLTGTREQQWILSDKGCWTKASPNGKSGVGNEEGKGKQVTSGVALRGQVHDWVKGQGRAFEWKAGRTKLPCGCVGIRGQGKKTQEKEEGVRKIQNSSRKKPHLPQHRSQAECSRNRLEVFVYSVLPPRDLFSPLSLGKDLVFLQVLSLTASAKNSQLFWALRSKSLISTLCEIFI